ncbi:MAG: phosphomannose isomerase type II C-terminal cupin domain [Elainellaceae cyanobacterium]
MTNTTNASQSDSPLDQGPDLVLEPPQEDASAATHRCESRPWGSFTVLEEGKGYKIKRVEVNPGERLSLQMHYHRSEHWIVVSGTARVIRGDDSTLICSNQSTYVPVCTPHRLENPGVIPLVLIEVQNGEYLNESDVTRFDTSSSEDTP